MQCRKKDHRIDDQQRAVAFEHFGIRQSEQAAHACIFGLVQFEQLITFINLEERFVFCKRLLFEWISFTHIHRKGKITPC